MNIRKFTSKDADDVLEIFRLNTPLFFDIDEEKDLIHYLTFEAENYFILEFDNQIIGSGGINFAKKNTIGVISWDILHPDFQSKGFGSKLLKYRLDLLCKMVKIQTIIVRTSQLVYPYYEKSGFKLIEVQKDYWAKGFDLYYMEYIN